MIHRLFLYGTLCDAELFEIVAGVPLAARPATLAGAAVYSVENESFPVLVAANGTAPGIVVEVDNAAHERLDFYELGFGYNVETREVETGDDTEEALVYVPEPGRWAPGAPWLLEDWRASHGELTRLAAREYMPLIATHSPEAAARVFPQVRMRAASRLRARREPTPEIAPGMAGAELRPQQTRQPYTDYFAVREDWLAFPRFDGASSPVVKRASFMGGDAVTVLPYDPAIDKILIVRQFRHGPFCRGDANPWTLEPAAGRIDPGETPRDAAQRELDEETGVEMRSLHFIGRYYPSPGAFSEYIYSYVAIANLAAHDENVGGLEEEAEDIMAHVVSFDEAMALVETGAANTGPLILSLGWLALYRDRLQGFRST